MADPGDSQPEPLRRLVNWAVDHVVAEANFEGEHQLIVGDRDELATLDIDEVLPVSGAWTWLPPRGGRALAIVGPGPERDGPWVWALGSDDGPLASIEISPDLDLADSTTEPDLIGRITIRSGILVIGNYNSIRWWGTRAVPSTPDRTAEFRLDNDVPGPLRDSYLLVAAVPSGSVCEVLGARSRTGQVVAFSIRMPVPSWLPEPMPLRDY